MTGMVRIFIAVLSVTLPLASIAADSADPTAGPREAVQSFYAAFKEGFTKSAEFATDDWNHINPFGGRTHNKKEVLAEVREVHSTFLKGTSETLNKLDVRLASSDVAVVTTISTISPFTAPDGSKHVNERYIRTFVVVRRGGRWLVMQDQNTVMSPAQ